jgi:hypothetical protein
MWEAEIRKIEDCGLRPVRQKVSETPISTNKLGVVKCIYGPSNKEGYR